MNEGGFCVYPRTDTASGDCYKCETSEEAIAYVRKMVKVSD